MSDDAGVALLAYVDAVHLDDALAWVETGSGGHRAWKEKDRSGERVRRKKNFVNPCDTYLS